MALTYSKNYKLCLTCAFWAGSRECDNTGNNVHVKNSLEKGKCQIPNGPYKNAIRTAGQSSCNKFQKWLLLK